MLALPFLITFSILFVDVVVVVRYLLLVVGFFGVVVRGGDFGVGAVRLGVGDVVVMLVLALSVLVLLSFLFWLRLWVWFWLLMLGCG